MALLKSIFQVPTRPQIGVMLLDIAIKETHTRTANVTENEVEDGSVVSDHVRINPDKLILEGQISSFPVGLGGVPGITAVDLQRKILGSEGLVDDTNKKVRAGIRKKPEDAWKYLEDTFKLGEPIQIVTGLQTYGDMIIEELTAPRTSKDGKSLIFTIKLKRIKFAITELTASFKIDPDVNGSGKNHKGSQPSKEATGKAKKRGPSILQSVFKIGIP